MTRRMDAVVRTVCLNEDDAQHEREIHERVSRPTRSTFPSMSCIRTFIFTTFKPMMLDEIDKFKQVDSDKSLSYECCKERQSPNGKGCQYGEFQ